MSLYFLEGWRQDKRRGLLDCLSDYLGFFAENVTHFQTLQKRGYRRWSKDGLPEPYRKMDSIGSEEDFYFSMIEDNPEESDDPSLWRISTFGFSRNDKNRPLSGLKAHFPPSFVFDDPDRFVQLVRSWSERLGAIHGSAGLGALSVPGSETMKDAYYYPWLMHYPALEYDAMGDYWSEVRHGGYRQPRSSNWLTALGDDNVAALGGASAVKAQLTEEMTLSVYDGGVLIRASQLPALGDPATGGIPEGYRTAARIIKPIRFEGYQFSVIKLPRHLNTGREGRLAETLSWIRRFD
ncbi:type VI immunity family protein [Consotaella aegiceratis]|uniref:type VI immunity family protein n=2 Tax=Consotaella aegiceratis TaxID=3097961 RepID=UPI002F408E9D